ncbi:hypothetical protein J2853_002843 [Streptosporangium lutulentum]|uniref:Uncharacterized protein n=1 Tax=Streptosporangium lutulentum TaxID=1461250 RepID=A0ABT9QA44_9ACTN|nr:hypothetical protein [Streptosporangium lutulentum]
MDSTTARVHHHAAGTALDPQLIQELEKAAAVEKRLRERGKNLRRGSLARAMPRPQPAADYGDGTAPG